MPEEDQLAGMDEEGLRRTLGELLASNRAMQANFDEIRQQFPIQNSNLSSEVPSWSELEEGGLNPPGGEEPESFKEQLGLEAFADVIWVEISAAGAILRGGAGLVVEHPSTGIYKVWLQGGNTFHYPGALRQLTASTAGSQAISANVNLIESAKGVKGYEIVLVSNVASTEYRDSNFHFSAANLSAE